MGMKRALVIGLGLSGKAACQLLRKMGYEVFAVDRDSKQVQDVHILEENAVNVADFACIVPSPGVSPFHPLYAKGLELGIPILGEAQLALSQLSQKIIGISGTNGKTTVTSLVTHILVSAGYKARSLGNIGDPLALYALKSDPSEILVVELSSYQLETMQGELLDAAVILNITPDHLDRYPSMLEYVKAKWRIHGCMKRDKTLIVYDKTVEEFGDFGKTVMTYSLDQPLARKLANEYTELRGHDLENILAAMLLLEEFKITEEQVHSAVATFKKPSHRIEYLGTIAGVRYYDDSKGTNLDAVIRAVECMQGPVWLIAGGVDKGASYALWKQPFAGKVKKIFAIGQAKNKILQEAKEFCVVEESETLEQAVKKAANEAQAGGNILLSPGCSSFDMFRDYAHRGEEFQRLVKSLHTGETV